MIYTHALHIEHVVRSVKEQLRDRPDHGVLNSDTVLALDIVTHALEFTTAHDGFFLWREALWGRTLHEEAQVSLVRMLEHVLSAAERGEMSAITDICDCLQPVISPDVFRGSNAHIGGRRDRNRSPVGD